jgi:hypothetical protein
VAASTALAPQRGHQKSRLPACTRVLTEEASKAKHHHGRHRSLNHPTDCTILLVGRLVHGCGIPTTVASIPNPFPSLPTPTYTQPPKGALVPLSMYSHLPHDCVQQSAASGQWVPPEVQRATAGCTRPQQTLLHGARPTLQESPGSRVQFIADLSTNTHPGKTAAEAQRLTDPSARPSSRRSSTVTRTTGYAPPPPSAHVPPVEGGVQHYRRCRCCCCCC